MNMTINCLSGGGGNGKTGAKRVDAKAEEPKEELGALKLDETEISDFEKWATETAKPTSYMEKAAKTHRAFQLKMKR
jgi:hypothetical protein